MHAAAGNVASLRGVYTKVRMRSSLKCALLRVAPGLALAIGFVAAAWANSGRSSANGSEMATVSCKDAVLRLKSGNAGGFHVVLGVVSVGPAFLEGVVPTPGEPWPFWRKQGINIRAGSPAVEVSVSKAWRKRVAIGWGGVGPVSALRFAACSPPPTFWYGYAGGFNLRSSSACVPLVFRVGKRSVTLRFGVGRHCTRWS
jgi:hypothetical protein